MLVRLIKLNIFTAATNKHVKEEMFAWQFALWTAKKNYSFFILVVPELAKQLVLSTELFTSEVNRSRNICSLGNEYRQSEFFLHCNLSARSYMQVF